MGEKIVVGPINKGLRSDRTAFVIDNDSFPVLQNAYQWRGRIKRKRGTSLLTRLNRFFNSANPSYGSITTIVFDGSGIANLISGFGLETNGNIVPGTITFTGSIGAVIYVDIPTPVALPNGNIFINGTNTVAGTINYSTGIVTIAAQAGGNLTTATFIYNPNLPVLGLRDLQLVSTQFPGTLAFDQKYSYNIVTASPYPNYDVSFYKNPPTGTYTGYTQKTNASPLTWNGQDYQQFWSTNYEGAFWVTNGINIPFSTTNVGMQFKPIITVTVTAGGPPAIVTLNITGHGLVVGDFVFINEVNTTKGINFQTGYVISVIDINNVSVEFPNATITNNGTGGIAQYLTSSVPFPTKDCIRYYDGDPTDGSSTNPVLTPGNGWVNFCPPLSQFDYSIAELPPDQYYLVTARMIVPFKGRLLFLGCVVQNSGGGIFYLQDTVIYSQDGTPYYTFSYTNSPSAIVDTPTNPPASVPGFTPILVPINRTATPSAWFEDQTGFGGFVSVGLAQPITTCAPNRDVLLVGLSKVKVQLVFTGDDIIPFLFYIINSDYGDASTFSTITMDAGVLSRGTHGFTISNQNGVERIDLPIPDEVFQINMTENGNERLCSIRDFINEWVYFTFPENNDSFRYPNKTLMYNYRDQSWSSFNESYTSYGSFRRQTGFTWQTVGFTYSSWAEWNDPWNAGESTLLQQEVIAGNQQGFVLARDEGTGEGTSLYIQSFSGLTNIVTSPDHNLVNGDFIVISGVFGTIGAVVNGNIYRVFTVTQNTFQLDPDPLLDGLTYLGGGLITRMYKPLIMTKQFPVSWGLARKTRLGPQQYLLTTTANAQITLLIFLSQNSANAYNDGSIVPDLNSINRSLIYSNILYTCPESTNLGLTPANINLQTPTGAQQDQIWHRINTSLIGDTIQLGFTLSDDQMRDSDITELSYAITDATQANPCVLTCTSPFESGQIITISDVVGMTELNGNNYVVLTSDATTVTIDVDSRRFTEYVSGGFATHVSGINGFSEIELHGFTLECAPSQMLV